MDRSCSTKERTANVRAPTETRIAFATDAVVLAVVGLAHSATRASCSAPKIAYRICTGKVSGTIPRVVQGHMQRRVGAPTSLEANQELGSTLIVLRKRYEIRKGTTMSSTPRGRIDSILSWKSKVRSNPPRHAFAYGPKVLSTCLHVAGVAILASTVSSTE